MLHIQHRPSLVMGRWSLVIAIATNLILASSAPSIPDADEAALRVLVDKFFAAYQKKDLDGFMGLWSAKSPDFASRKQTMQRLFAQANYTFVNLTLARVKVEGNGASLSAFVEYTAINVQTQQSRKERIARAFAFVKEGGAWKVWRYYPAADDLADALVAAKTEEERVALLAAEKELVSGELRQALARLGDRFRLQENYPQALTAYRLAQSVAEHIGDKAGIARSLSDIGDVYQLQGDFGSAMNYYQRSLNLKETANDKRGMALTLYDLGKVYVQQGDSARALECYQKSLKLAEELDDKQSVALTLNVIASVYQQRGDFAQAVEYYQKSLTMIETLKDKAWAAATWGVLGDVYEKQGNAASALACYQKSLQLKQELGDRTGVGDTLRTIGFSYNAQGNPHQALEYYQKALAQFEALKDTKKIAQTLHNMGFAYQARSDYERAVEVFQQSSMRFEAIGDKNNAAYALAAVGHIHDLRGNYGQALECFRKALAQFEEVDNPYGMALMLSGIGTIYGERGDFVQALEFYQKTLALPEPRDQQEIAARIATLVHIGGIHFLQSNHSSAAEYYYKALAQYEALKDKRGVAFALRSIGSVYQSQSNYGLALAFFRKALAQYETLADRKEIASTLSDIGGVYQKQGDTAQALEYFQKCLTQYEEMGNKAEVADVLRRIGLIHQLHGNCSLALESQQKSLELCEALQDKRGIAATLYQIGLSHTLSGRHPQALEFYQKALVQGEAIGDKFLTAALLREIGYTYSLQGDFSQGARFAERAADVARDNGFSEVLWRTRFEAGACYHALNQPIPARQAYEEAINAIETIRHQVAGGELEQQRFFENKVDPYYAMVELLIEQNKLADALTYAERAKARVLLDVLHSGKVNVTKSMTETEREQERALNHQLVSLNTQIFRESQRKQPDENRLADLRTQLHKARLDYEAFQTTLYAAHPQLKVQRGQAKPLTLEETNALLPDAKTALLEFVVTEGKTYLFVLSSPEPQTQNLKPLLKVYPIDIPQKDLAERVTRLREMVAARRSGFPRLARELYDRLLKPAQAQQQGKTHLVIIPDGVLWELPFQALQVKENRYLIEDAAISYAPSLTVLREMQKVRLGVGAWGRGGNKNTPSRPTPPTPPPTLLAFGNPSLGKGTVERVHLVHRGENLNPLPEAEKEVKDLRQLYGATRCKVYVGADAREERVKSEGGNYRILHFATHGFVNDRSPMYSQVVLAQVPSSSPPLSPAREGSEDGLLEAWEILNLDLQADLVVLSACETARGRVSAGEGVIGLTWGLFVAGCPTTVVSQWKVADASTRQLMVEFHRQLRAQSKVEALRQAQLKLMKDGKHNHPFYWAAFVLVGDGR